VKAIFGTDENACETNNCREDGCSHDGIAACPTVGLEELNLREIVKKQRWETTV
jgi:hypothetical protein